MGRLSVTCLKALATGAERLGELLERAANAHELDDAPRREVWRQLNTVAVIAELPEHRRELSKAIYVRRGVGGQLLHRKPPSGATSSAPATRIRSSATLDALRVIS